MRAFVDWFANIFGMFVDFVIFVAVIFCAYLIVRTIFMGKFDF